MYTRISSKVTVQKRMVIKLLSTVLLHLLSFQSSLQSGQNMYKSYYCFSSHAYTAFTVQPIVSLIH